MSWSSLFSFDANGRIGSTYTATNASLNSTAVGSSSLGAGTYTQNLATFTGLPVGVYSVRVSFPITNSGILAFTINNWNIGAGTSNSTLTLGSNSITSFATSCAAVADTSTAIIDFTINNTSGAAVIYINSLIDIAASNTQLVFASTYTTTASIVATKMA
jgi:hypothetical protein